MNSLIKQDGVLCVDRPSLIPKTHRIMTYADLLERIQKFTNDVDGYGGLIRRISYDFLVRRRTREGLYVDENECSGGERSNYYDTNPLDSKDLAIYAAAVVGHLNDEPVLIKSSIKPDLREAGHQIRQIASLLGSDVLLVGAGKAFDKDTGWQIIADVYIKKDTYS